MGRTRLGWGRRRREPLANAAGRSREAKRKEQAGPCGIGQRGPAKWKSLNHTELLTAPKSFCAGAASLGELKLLDA